MRRARGFTLVELLVVIAIIAMLMGILMPLFVRILGQAKLAVCRARLKSVGTAVASYQSRNDQRWPWIDNVTSDWSKVATGTNRDRSPAADANNGGERSITALMFLLVRDGEAPGLFVCPSDDSAGEERSLRHDDDGREETDEVFYWDFSAASKVSYSWQAPVKKGDRYVNGISAEDGSTVVMADKTPAASEPGWTPQALAEDTPPSQLRLGMSRNHFGGEAANLLRADLSVRELKRPDEGYECDNIYTAAGKANRGARDAVSLDIARHLSVRDSFLVGPVGK